MATAMKAGVNSSLADGLGPLTRACSGADGKAKVVHRGEGLYVWSLAEVEQALGPDTAFFVQHYDVTAEGNFRDPHDPRRGTQMLQASTDP